ncbi:hypothetical protein NMG60_11017796 [Bertholletia excelsa]
MYRFLKSAQELHTKTLSFYAQLIDHCLSVKSLDFTKHIHAELIKVGFNRHVFLGNRCVDLYAKIGSTADALQAFDDIAHKNIVSWNICLRVLVKSGSVESARNLFDKIPERDTVTWNTMMSGYTSNGLVGYALEIFMDMRNASLRPDEFTFSILASFVMNAYHGKEIHGGMMRSGINLVNVVVGNSVIDMYGRLGLVDYAFRVFKTMEEVGVISWNSLIWGCCKSGNEKLALDQFFLMISTGFSPDEFTISTVTTICTNLRDLDRGKQVFAFCFKVGFLSNTIVCSAAIDMFSKCNRLEDSIRVFEDINIWDSIVCNSMISSYARHGLVEDALQLFVCMLRIDLRPTEFTLSSAASSASSLLPAEQGSQFHSLVVKLGMESDRVVASSLVEMYTKFGLIDTSIRIFAEINVKDLISWNTMILGLIQNGRVAETLQLFKELLERGPAPDEITLLGVLLACSYGGFVDEGIGIFSSMEKRYGVRARDDHYQCIIEMMCRVGKLKEAMDIIEAMPHEPSPSIWELILHSNGADGKLELTEKAAERLIMYEPWSPLPYMVLAQAYEMRGRWESMIRVKRAMKENGARKVIGSSWIGIRNHVVVFKANHIPNYEEIEFYEILRLLILEMGLDGSSH